MRHAAARTVHRAQYEGPLVDRLVTSNAQNPRERATCVGEVGYDWLVACDSFKADYSLVWPRSDALLQVRRNTGSTIRQGCGLGDHRRCTAGAVLLHVAVARLPRSPHTHANRVVSKFADHMNEYRVNGPLWL